MTETLCNQKKSNFTKSLGVPEMAEMIPYEPDMFNNSGGKRGL